jgi:putative transcriptional regulator
VGRQSAQGRSNAVRAARTSLRLTQAELAAAAGVTRQTVVAVEAGDYAPSVYLALALAERLGCSVEELFGPGATAGVDAASAGHAGGAEESNR